MPDCPGQLTGVISCSTRVEIDESLGWNEREKKSISLVSLGIIIIFFFFFLFSFDVVFFKKCDFITKKILSSDFPSLSQFFEIGQSLKLKRMRVLKRRVRETKAWKSTSSSSTIHHHLNAFRSLAFQLYHIHTPHHFLKNPLKRDLIKSAWGRTSSHYFHSSLYTLYPLLTSLLPLLTCISLHYVFFIEKIEGKREDIWNALKYKNEWKAFENFIPPDWWTCPRWSGLCWEKVNFFLLYWNKKLLERPTFLCSS